MIYILTYYTTIDLVACLNIWTDGGYEVFFTTEEAAMKERDRLRQEDKRLRYIQSPNLSRL
jgi:hypothetical protein